MDSLDTRKIIVVGMEHYNPLGLIRILGKNGISPDYIAIKHKSKVASLSKYVSRVHQVDSIEQAVELLLSEYGTGYDEAPVILTTDDDVQSLIDDRYEEFKDRFIFFNSGQAGRTTEFMDKKKILDVAKKNGLQILDTWSVKKGDIPDDLTYPIITKSISPNVGGWKSDVFICESEEDLRKAFEKIESPQVLLQRYLDKKNEICIDGFSIDSGRALFNPICTTYNYNLDGYYSPYMTMHPYFLDEKTTRGIADMMAEIGFEGVYSIEFLLGPDDELYFTEINFRNSPWNCGAAKMGMPIPLLWIEAMLTGRIQDNWYRPVPKGFKAMIEPVDHRKRVLEGDLDLADWLTDFKNVECPFYQDNDDPEPFREMVRNWEKLS